MAEFSSADREEIIRRISRDLADGYDEELEMEIEDRHPRADGLRDAGAASREDRHQYFSQLFRLQAELIKLQDWVVATRQTGRHPLRRARRRRQGRRHQAHHAKRLNPRVCRAVALPAPNDRERTQWYFQRYVPHLPAAGEIVLLRSQLVQPRRRRARHGVLHRRTNMRNSSARCRSSSGCWCARASGLLKYWFSITDEEQHLRFLGRIHDPLKQWKLSPMDLESRRRWEEYTRPKRSCCSAPTSPRRAGGWYMRSTRSGRGSTASTTC